MKAVVFEESDTSERKATPAERFFTRSPFSIVTIVARIKGNVTEGMLKNAVAKVQQRHALLQMRIKDDENHTQWFTTEDVQEIPVAIVSRRSKDDLELDRLIMQPGGGIHLVNVNLVLGAVTCAGKLSLVIEYAKEAIDTATMIQVRAKALGFLH